MVPQMKHKTVSAKNDVDRLNRMAEVGLAVVAAVYGYDGQPTGSRRRAENAEQVVEAFLLSRGWQRVAGLDSWHHVTNRGLQLPRDMAVKFTVTDELAVAWEPIRRQLVGRAGPALATAGA